MVSSKKLCSCIPIIAEKLLTCSAGILFAFCVLLPQHRG